MTEFETRALAHLAGIENAIGVLGFAAWAVFVYVVLRFMWKNS